MVKLISVIDVAGRGDTADQGVVLHKALVTSLRDSSGPVSIDFHGLTTITSSFANLAFVQLLTEWRLSELKKRLKIVNSTRQINEMVKSRLEREGDGYAAAARRA
jgi:hypothetical protein